MEFLQLLIAFGLYKVINQYWKQINKLKSRNATKSKNTFDFSTLYTKLPHDKLCTVLPKPIGFLF